MICGFSTVSGAQKIYFLDFFISLQDLDFGKQTSSISAGSVKVFEKSRHSISTVSITVRLWV